MKKIVNGASVRMWSGEGIAVIFALMLHCPRYAFLPNPTKGGVAVGSGSDEGGGELLVVCVPVCERGGVFVFV